MHVQETDRVRHRFVAGVHIDRQDQHLILGIGALQGGQSRHLGAAGRAPHGPQVDHHHPAPEIGEGDLRAFAIGEDLIGGDGRRDGGLQRAQAAAGMASQVAFLGGGGAIPWESAAAHGV